MAAVIVNAVILRRYNAVISPLTGLGYVAVLLLIEYCLTGNKLRFHYQAHP